MGCRAGRRVSETGPSSGLSASYRRQLCCRLECSSWLSPFSTIYWFLPSSTPQIIHLSIQLPLLVPWHSGSNGSMPMAGYQPKNRSFFPPSFRHRQNMYIFLYVTKAYIGCCYTQAKTQHIHLIKCNENLQNLNVCLDDGTDDGSGWVTRRWVQPSGSPSSWHPLHGPLLWHVVWPVVF